VVRSLPGGLAKFLGAGRRIVTSDGGSVKVWDTSDGQLLVSLGAPGKTYGYSGTSPDGRRVAAVTIDGGVRVGDAPPETEESGGETRILGGATERFSAVAFRPSDRHLAAASTDGTVRVWDVAAGHEQFVVRDHDGPVFDLAYSP